MYVYVCCEQYDPCPGCQLVLLMLYSTSKTHVLAVPDAHQQRNPFCWSLALEPDSLWRSQSGYETYATTYIPFTPRMAGIMFGAGHESRDVC